MTGRGNMQVKPLLHETQPHDVSVKAIAFSFLTPSPGTPGEGWGEGLSSESREKALTLTLSRRTGRGNRKTRWRNSKLYGDYSLCDQPCCLAASTTRCIDASTPSPVNVSVSDRKTSVTVTLFCPFSSGL